jgi:AraC-like DNA-binding protein
LPAVHALHIAAVVQRWGQRDALLSDCELNEEELAHPDARMPIRTFERFVDRARALTGEPAIGVYLGLQMQASAHGYLGFAAMTAATVREGIELAVRFLPTRTTALGLRLDVEGAVGALVLEEHADFGTARDVVLMALIIGLWQIGTAITGQVTEGGADFAIPEPSYWARVAAVAMPEWRGVTAVRFAQPANRLLFDATDLDQPLTMADPASLRLASEHCERELGLLGQDGPIVARARRLVVKDGGVARSVEEVAGLLHLSPRTLQRRLAGEGVTHGSLVDDELRDRAMQLLQSSDLPLEQVAARLGYSDVSNFTRAFRRWTGATPAQYRRSGQDDDEPPSSK